MHLSEESKLHIINLKERKYTYSQIADIYQINVKTVNRIIKKYNTENSISRQIGTGRINKYDIDDIIKILFKNNHHLTLNQASSILKMNYNIKCSKTTIYYRLHNLGYLNDDPISKPLLKPEHFEKRKFWTMLYKNYNWDNVIWSDEAAISIQSNSYSKIWFHKDDVPIKRIVKNPLKIHIWGYIIKNKGLYIHIYDKTMTGNKYIETLQENLLPLLKKFNKKKRNALLFQQDNAPAHTRKINTNFFIKNDINIMYWPPNSPDLNPIENVWNILKRRVGTIFVKTKEELISTIIKSSNEIKISVINNIIDSMDNRIDELIVKKYDSINY
jgi:transposase